MYSTEEYEQIVANIGHPQISDVWTVLSTHVGKEDAIHLDSLVSQVKALGHVRGRYAERTVRKCCEIMRWRKLPIYSGREGYCLGLPHEMFEWAKSYRAGAFSKLRLADHLLKVVKTMMLTDELKEEVDKVHDEIQMTLKLEGNK